MSPVRLVALGAALGAAVLPACTPTIRAASATSAPARTADARAVARAVRLCETTEADLRRQLGEPTRDGRLRDARVVSWIVGESDVVSYLAVLLDAEGVAVDLYWDLPTEVLWTPSNQCR